MPLLPLFNETGDAKFCGVVVVSPNTSNLLCTGVPIADNVLNFLVCSSPSPSKLTKSSIELSPSSIS